jgi:hypothetical protein
VDSHNRELEATGNASRLLFDIFSAIIALLEYVDEYDMLAGSTDLDVCAAYAELHAATLSNHTWLAAAISHF